VNFEIDFKNIKIHYSISGIGSRTIVWLHGFMEDLSIWDAQLLSLNESCVNICIDLLGHGKTGVADRESSMEMQAEVVMFVIDYLKIRNFSIIGHSMGGYVGLSVLDKHSSRIDSFILLNSTCCSDTLKKKESRMRATKIVARQKESFIRMGVVNSFSKKSRERLAVEIEELIGVAKLTSAKAIVAALLGMMNRVCKSDILKKYKGPKLIIAGEKDPILSVSDSRIEAKIVEASFVILPGGHMSYLESSIKLIEVIKSFIFIKQ